MWFSVVCSLVYKGMRHHSGQNVVASMGRVSRQQILTTVITHTTVYKNTDSTRWVHLNLHLYSTNPCFILFQSYNAYYYLCSLEKKKKHIARSLVSPIAIFTNLAILAVSYEKYGA